MKLLFWIFLVVGLLPGLNLLGTGFLNASVLARRSIPPEVQAKAGDSDYVIVLAYVGRGRFRVPVYPSLWKTVLLLCGVLLYLAGAFVMFRGKPYVLEAPKHSAEPTASP